MNRLNQSYSCGLEWTIIKMNVCFWLLGTVENSEMLRRLTARKLGQEQSDIEKEKERERETQSMDHLLCAVLNEKALLQMNKVLPKGSLWRPSLPLAWCHDQFNTQAACPPLLTHCLMAFSAQASFKLLFIAVVFLLFDSSLQHLSI